MTGLLERVLQVIADELPHISIPRQEDPYLERYRAVDTRWFSVMLHRFRRSDADQELHNHPWSWAVSLVLSGGYSEERMHRSGAVYRRSVWPGRFNLIFSDTFHRVDLFGRDCWTLFVTGPRTQSWGFLDRDTGKFTPWREFVAVRGG